MSRDSKIQKMETLLHNYTKIHNSDIPTTLEDMFLLLEQSPNLAKEFVKDLNETQHTDLGYEVNDDHESFVSVEGPGYFVSMKYDLILPVQFILRHQDLMVQNYSEPDVMRLCLKFAHLYPQGLLMTDLSLRGFDQASKDENSSLLPLHGSMSYLLTHSIWIWMDSIYKNRQSSDNRISRRRISQYTMPLTLNRISMSRNIRKASSTGRSSLWCRKSFHYLLSPVQKSNNQNMHIGEDEQLNIDTALPASDSSIPSDLKFLLKLLSNILTQDDSDDDTWFGTESFSRSNDTDKSISFLSDNTTEMDEVIESIIVIVASIPSFVKSLLFLNKYDRAEVFDSTFVKHVVLEGRLVSSWIRVLFQEDTDRALWYFQYLSLYLDDDINSLLVIRNSKSNQDRDDPLESQL